MCIGYYDLATSERSPAEDTGEGLSREGPTRSCSVTFPLPLFAEPKIGKAALESSRRAPLTHLRRRRLKSHETDRISSAVNGVTRLVWDFRFGFLFTPPFEGKIHRVHRHRS